MFVLKERLAASSYFFSDKVVSSSEAYTACSEEELFAWSMESILQGDLDRHFWNMGLGKI